ncbi:type I restriction enzyme HsdR N-terminal domain-containing protein [Pluralibacter gergoviae]|uniref:type I restriction enzyme HsdR N-terminal domain-containing protein n=1 Tax=Pluralibacter gergoviae TaxID=61647 RepID=UPI001EF0E7DB|nr:type I restriction enzyme HsdR N-terminal domain-containing protein [Pluralibacter gergoviae]
MKLKLLCARLAVKYGLWTNGLEFFFVEKEQQRFETKCNPIGDWPMAEESVGTKEIISMLTRVADNEMLKITFRRCYNFIHGNEGSKGRRLLAVPLSIFCKCMTKTFGNPTSVMEAAVLGWP